MVDLPLPETPLRIQRDRDALAEAPALRRALIGFAVTVLALFLFLPLATVFIEAFGKGVAGFLSALSDAEVQSSIKLTLIVATICVPINTAFGIAAAWAVARFEFTGKSALVTFIDLPFSVSPVIAGLCCVLLFGARGLLGPQLASHGIEVIFAVASLLALLAVITLVVKTLLEWRFAGELALRRRT